MIIRTRFALACAIVSCLVTIEPALINLTSSSEPSTGVIKAKEPIEVVGVVVAYSPNTLPIGGEGGSMGVLVVKVEKTIKGKVPSAYVRADLFEDDRVSYPNSTESLYKGKPWRMKLEVPPAASQYFCAFTVPPHPKTGEIDPIVVPYVVPVPGAHDYPDLNSLPCFVLDRNNLQPSN